MMNREKKRQTLEICYDEYHKIKAEMLPVGLRLGWYDENGKAGPLEDMVNGRLSDEEAEAIHEKENIYDAVDFIKLQFKRNKIAKRIVKLEDELGIPLEESKA